MKNNDNMPSWDEIFANDPILSEIKTRRQRWINENPGVAIGYSTDMTPLENWQEYGMICCYEHCIENSPLASPRGTKSCPLFGHDCPGGEIQVAVCDAWRED